MAISTEATQPRRRRLNSSAHAYLAELEMASKRAQQLREQASTVEQLTWHTVPQRQPRSDAGEGSAYNSPVMQLDARLYRRIQADVEATCLDAADLAWWWATAAITAARAALAGQDVTARDLELATRGYPGRAEKVEAETVEWAPVFRAELPTTDADLTTGAEYLDRPVALALARLRAAYSAAAAIEAIDEELSAEVRTPAEWEQPTSEQQAAARSIPDLLATFADVLTTALFTVTAGTAS